MDENWDKFLLRVNRIFGILATMALVALIVSLHFDERKSLINETTAHSTTLFDRLALSQASEYQVLSVHVQANGPAEDAIDGCLVCELSSGSTTVCWRSPETCQSANSTCVPTTLKRENVFDLGD